MKTIALGILVFLPLFSWSQTVSKTEVLPTAKYKHLLNSPSQLACDSLQSLRVTGNFWYNNMPMADNSVIHWDCGIGTGGIHFSEPQCSQFKTTKIYFFYEEEVFVFSFDFEKEGKQAAKKIYNAPLFVVIEYYDVKTQKKGFIRSRGAFPVESVE